MRLVLPLLLALVSLPALAQGTIRGTVLDEHGEPLENVSVYLSGTQRGDASDAQGRFEIPSVAPGAYRVVGSLVGYEAAAEEVTVEDGTEHIVDLMLFRARRTVGFVRVEAPRDRTWLRQRGRFERAFLGESARADSVRILNPEVLELGESAGALVATAGKPLVIENRALGYRLTYDLRRLVETGTEVRYDGDVRFEPLSPSSPAEAARWQAARAHAYRGSLDHLLRTIVRDDLDRSGFLLTLDETGSDEFSSFDRSQTARPARRRDLFRADREGGGRLTFDGTLSVLFEEPEDPAFTTSTLFRGDRRQPETVQRSAIELRAREVRLDARGTPEAPLDLLTRGYFGFERIADLVPADYELPSGL